MWFRRDLRLGDHPALHKAAAGGPVVALFVSDPRLRKPAGSPRLAFLSRCHRRDEAVERMLSADARCLERVGSPYAVDPGTAVKNDGEPFRVFTHFYRAWTSRGRTAPLPAPPHIDWSTGVRSDGIPPEPPLSATLPPAGEPAALARLDAFMAGPGSDYDTKRDEPEADATTRLSPYLKFGCIHPRQVLDRLGRSKAHEKLRSELAAGRTGYPLVDAGMRQLLAEAWMPNRVRFVAASFLVKNLHIDWVPGARWFLRHLVDGDPASNSHGVGGGPPGDYPAPIVDHREERAEALERYARVREDHRQ